MTDAREREQDRITRLRDGGRPEDVARLAEGKPDSKASDFKIGLSEVLAVIGDCNVRFQMIPASLDGNQSAIKRGGSRLSFACDESLTDVINGRRIAFVVWMDREQLDDAMAVLRARKAG